jgi:hypothetical protein
MSYAVERTGTNVLTLRHTIIDGWEQYYLLIADVHWDNPHCRRDILKRHLELAKKRGAGILSFGDFFCAMQGKYDPRASKESVRPEHQCNNYLDALIDTAADYLAPYSDNLVMLSDGNHETAIRKRQETDLLGRLSQKVSTQHLGYSGFVRFMFEHAAGGKRSTKNMYWHHGSGGGGPVTKGVIGTNRRAVYVPDAHFVVGGHIHEEFRLVLPRVRITNGGRVHLDEQVHICLPTYKDEFDLFGGYHVENGRPPKPIGGAWLRLFYDPSQFGSVAAEILPAK